MPPSQRKQARSIRGSPAESPSHTSRSAALGRATSVQWRVFDTAPASAHPRLSAFALFISISTPGRLNLAAEFDALVESETADQQLRFMSCFFELFVSSFFPIFFPRPPWVTHVSERVEWNSWKCFHVGSSVRPYFWCP